jgi:hypothetical protein
MEVCPSRLCRQLRIYITSQRHIVSTATPVYSPDVVTIRACNLVGGHQRVRKLIPIAVTRLHESKTSPYSVPVRTSSSGWLSRTL